MKVQIHARTDGKGHWTEETRLVLISKLLIGYNSHEYYPEEPFNGELRAYFDPAGNAPGAWSTDAWGLIYTDKQWLREFKRGLRAAGISIKGSRDVEFSEQGMQSTNYVSMDVGPVFYASWKRLQKKLSLPE